MSHLTRFCTFRLASDHLQSIICSEKLLNALEFRREALEYAFEFAGDMEGRLVDEFVGMYVNQRTLDLGADGRESVKEFLERGYRAGLIPEKPRVDFFQY